MNTIKTAWAVEDLGCARVAVIGAGNMGGGIAAQFANAGISVDLLDRAGPDEARNQPAEQGLAQQIARLAFMGDTPVALVRVGNIEDHLERVAVPFRLPDLPVRLHGGEVHLRAHRATLLREPPGHEGRVELEI